MKTIIDLPPDLIRSAAQLGAAEGIALTDLMARLLRRHLQKLAKKRPREAAADDRELHEWRQELL
jgi:hypothetical protein